MTHPLSVLIYLSLFALAMRLTVVIDAPPVTDDVLNRAVTDALLDILAKHHIYPKEAADLLGYDKSQWSRICSGQLHLPSLTRLMRLPWNVLFDFIPELSRVVATHKLRNVAEGAAQQRRVS